MMEKINKLYCHLFFEIVVGSTLFVVWAVLLVWSATKFVSVNINYSTFLVVMAIQVWFFQDFWFDSARSTFEKIKELKKNG